MAGRAVNRNICEYCGPKSVVPPGYDSMGSRYTCLKKGFGAGKYTEKRAWQRRMGFRVDPEFKNKCGDNRVYRARNARSPSRSLVRSPVRSPVRSRRRSPVRSPRRSPVRSRRRSPVRSPRRSPVRSRRRSPVRSRRRSPVRSRSRRRSISPVYRRSPKPDRRRYNSSRRRSLSPRGAGGRR
jgi:hypothetical protein